MQDSRPLVKLSGQGGSQADLTEEDDTGTKPGQKVRAVGPPAFQGSPGSFWELLRAQKGARRYYPHLVAWRAPRWRKEAGGAPRAAAASSGVDSGGVPKTGACSHNCVSFKMPMGALCASGSSDLVSILPRACAAAHTPSRTCPLRTAHCLLLPAAGPADTQALHHHQTAGALDRRGA